MRNLCIAGLAFVASGIAWAQLPNEQDRLVATAKLWITVKYFHPYLAYRDIDWDKALVDTLPAIRSAASETEYKTAVALMLGALHDPATRIDDGGATEARSAGQRIWIHHGLPPAIGPPSNQFYSAFEVRPMDEVEWAIVPMGGFRASIRLSESAAASTGAAAAYPNPKPDRTYAEAYPAPEYRILAAYKIWGVFHYFFAYRDLMDEDWDELLPLFLPRFIVAKDAREYNLTIAEMLTHVADSNVRVESETLAGYFGKAAVGLRLRLIEKHAVATEILDPEARKAGLREGDIVKTVDGETLIDRFKRQAQYVSASTTQSLGYTVISRILNGAQDSTAALSIEDRAGNRKQISLKRSTGYVNRIGTQRSGDVLKLLPGNVGYVDLERLQAADIPQLMDKFRDTKAIVFDLRGQAQNPSAREIAARLSGDQELAAAIVTGPLTLTPDLQQAGKASPSSSYFFVETLPKREAWNYKGKAVGLIDERTGGAAEHDGLYLEAATKIEFIGMSSAGADSEITNFTVPGGIVISFSGWDVRHANSGKLQRLGIQPAITVAPTLTGIRAGKDEVLEKALEHISPKLPPVKRPSEKVLRSSR